MDGYESTDLQRRIDRTDKTAESMMVWKNNAFSFHFHNVLVANAFFLLVGNESKTVLQQRQFNVNTLATFLLC